MTAAAIARSRVRDQALELAVRDREVLVALHRATLAEGVVTPWDVALTWRSFAPAGGGDRDQAEVLERLRGMRGAGLVALVSPITRITPCGREVATFLEALMARRPVSDPAAPNPRREGEDVDAWTLRVLGELGSATARELAAQQGRAEQYVGKTLRGLRERGLVEREVDPRGGDCAPRGSRWRRQEAPHEPETDEDAAVEIAVQAVRSIAEERGHMLAAIREAAMGAVHGLDTDRLSTLQVVKIVAGELELIRRVCREEGISDRTWPTGAAAASTEGMVRQLAALRAKLTVEDHVLALVRVLEPQDRSDSADLKEAAARWLADLERSRASLRLAAEVV